MENAYSYVKYLLFRLLTYRVEKVWARLGLSGNFKNKSTVKYSKFIQTLIRGSNSSDVMETDYSCENYGTYDKVELIWT